MLPLLKLLQARMLYQFLLMEAVALMKPLQVQTKLTKVKISLVTSVSLRLFLMIFLLLKHIKQQFQNLQQVPINLLH
ncbi:MAG: hypothetical protein EBS68_15750 [Rhodobacteraceae bacterium]|nr:hypothetical protein [Paracoccaceae bacterium]